MLQSHDLWSLWFTLLYFILHLIHKNHLQSERTKKIQACQSMQRKLISSKYNLRNWDYLYTNSLSMECTSGEWSICPTCQFLTSKLEIFMSWECIRIWKFLIFNLYDEVCKFYIKDLRFRIKKFQLFFGQENGHVI